MKKTLLLFAILFAITAVNAQTVIYSENFDAMTAGQSLLSQSSQWTTWSGGIESESGTIINSLYQSAPNALLIQGTNDMLYKTNGLTSGHYAFDFDYYVPSTGEGAYFNLQHVNKTTWAFECYMGYCSYQGQDGSWGVLVYDTSLVAFAYVPDAWFHVNLDINMDQDLAKMKVNGQEVASWQFSTIPDTTNNTMNRLDALNFFAGCIDNVINGSSSTATGTYYVDNFVFTKYDGVGVAETDNEEVKVYPNPANSVLNVTTANANTLEIVNFLGQVVYAQAVNADQMQVNVSNLNSGVYFVRLKGETTITKKFIKE